VPCPERSLHAHPDRPRPTPRGVGFLLLFATIAVHPVTLAQNTPGLQKFEVSSISFEGNTTLGRSELLAKMASKESPSFFNKFLFNTISEKLGRKNEYLDMGTLGGDLKRLRTYYEHRGFSEAVIDTALAFDRDDSRVDITIRIAEGYRSTIDSISYLGIGAAPGVNWEGILLSQKIAAHDAYDDRLLEDEVTRVLKILANAGYANVLFVHNRDSSWARRYASTRNYKVQLTFNLGRRYQFGDVTIRQETDSLRGPQYREDITDDILIRQLAYTPGQYYSTDDSVTSVSNLNRLGIFDLRRMDMTVPPRGDTSVTVPTSILIRPKDKNELGPEIFFSDENGSLNIGFGASYTHRNFLGGARIFSTHLRFRTQTINEFPDYFSRNTGAVSNLDLTTELVQPYVFSNRIKGSWAFSYILDKQKPYLQNIIRNSFGFRSRFAEYTNGFLDWTLESVRSDTNQNLGGSLNDPSIRRQIQLLQPEQFNSVLSFTIQRDLSNDLFSPSEGFIHSTTFDEAGIFPEILKGLFPNLISTQFYRVTLIGRWYNDLTTHRAAILAFKLKGGLEDKYGASRSNPGRGIPQTYRFYAGGSTSVRGWNSRDLIASGDPQLGGNLVLEGSAELRLNVLQGLKDGLFDRIWLVQFVDVGNVWAEQRDFRITEIAVAAGLGMRYDTFFGPFRIDWGFRVYDPSKPQGHRWITQRQTFEQTFKEGIFHFGIGHAF